MVPAFSQRQAAHVFCRAALFAEPRGLRGRAVEVAAQEPHMLRTRSFSPEKLSSHTRSKKKLLSKGSSVNTEAS